MKKQFIIFLTLGITLLTVGAVGAASLFKSIEKEAKDEVHETFQPKNQDALKTVDLTINGLTNFTIIPSTDDQFHLDNTHYNINQTNKLTWSTKENKENTTITVNYDEIEKSSVSFSFFDLDIWDQWTDTVIQVPKGIETLNIMSQTHEDLNLSGLSLKHLNVDTPSFVSVDNLTTDTLSNKGADGSINVSASKITDKLDFNGEHANFSIISTSAKNFNLTTIEGSIDLGDVTGDVLVKNSNGTTFLNKVIGKSVVNHNNGTIDLKASGKIYPTKLSNNHGDIDFYIPNDKVANSLKLTTESGKGYTYADNELKESFELDKGSIPVELSTKEGIINIYFNTGYYMD